MYRERERYTHVCVCVCVFVSAGNTKGGSVTIHLTSCLTGLDRSVLHIKTKIVSCHTADSKPVKQEVSGTVILPPLVFPGQCIGYFKKVSKYLYHTIIVFMSPTLILNVCLHSAPKFRKKRKI
jgi:hypothetical protein